MEKIKCICVMRDLFRALAELESGLKDTYGLTLNEAMVLCSVGDETVTAGVIVDRTGLKASHASKVIRKVEEKGLLSRHLGEDDKRQMCFTLTAGAVDCLQRIKARGVEVPELLRPFFR